MAEPRHDDTPDGVHEAGHRAFIGGRGANWDTIGDLQLGFVQAQGITPATTFLDLACGSLRLGARLIPLLEPGRYVGMDLHIELIVYGVMCELGEATYRERRPRFVVSGDFDFDRLPAAPEMGIAQSLFTHLALDDAWRCLARLRPAMAPGGQFFATFREVDAPRDQAAASHSWAMFQYTRREMEEAGRAGGWTPRYIGGWGHPKDQRMIEYRAD